MLTGVSLTETDDCIAGDAVVGTAVGMTDDIIGDTTDGTI